jgi:hypothetical protein
MKKLISILVLSFLWYNNCFALDNKLEKIFPTGISKQQFCKLANWTSINGDIFKDTLLWGTDMWCHGFKEKYYVYFPKYKTEIIRSIRNNGVHFIFENVNQRMKCVSAICKKGDGVLKKIAYSQNEAYRIANPEYKEKEEKEKQRIAEEKRKKEEEKRIAEKPKKKEPKQIPEDEKVVAAASGTGFFVSKSGHIISNHHVIEGCDTTKLTFKGKEVVADVLAVDKMNDLAILKANLIPNKIYSVATEDAALLEDIIIAGYPLGKKS